MKNNKYFKNSNTGYLIHQITFVHYEDNPDVRYYNAWGSRLYNVDLTGYVEISEKNLNYFKKNW